MFLLGVALSIDERSLFVAETCEYRVWKVGIDAEHVDAKAGDTMAAKILLKNLPGLPDNITRGLGGRIWVGLVQLPEVTGATETADHLYLQSLEGREIKWLDTRLLEPSAR